MEIDMYKFAGQIKSKKDFDTFLQIFLKDFYKNCSDWENNSLERFIEALCAYSKDKGEVVLSWAFFAELLLAAKVYE